MLHALLDVRDTVADIAIVTSPVLTPDPEGQRAALECGASWDPEGLYALEVARDEAVAELADNVPADAAIAVILNRRCERVNGTWQTRNMWLAQIVHGQTALNAYGETPFVAVGKVLNAWRQTAPTPTYPRAA